MTKTVGYMITWTTYGTWLQGDERGYVKNGKIYSGNEVLRQANQQLQSQEAIRLSKVQQQLVQKAIVKEAQSQGQRIYALAVQSNHVHLLLEYMPRPLSKMVAHYKKAARLALRTIGHTGKVWAKGYDKRFCFDRATLEQRIKYVQGHDN